MPPTYKRKNAQSPRNQAIADPETGLPALTAKQESFVHGILSGKSPKDAYRASYDCSKMQEGAIGVEGSRLMRDPKIALSIRFHQRNGLDSTPVSRESHLAELARGREIAYELGQASAGIQAEHYRGRVAGLYNDRLTLAVGPTDEALLSQLASLLGPEIATVVGEALGPEPARNTRILELPPPLEE